MPRHPSFRLPALAENALGSDAARLALRMRDPAAKIGSLSGKLPILFMVAAALGCAVSGGLRAAPIAQRVVSQTVGTDEMLLALAEPGEVAALSQLARDPEYSAVSTEAQAYPALSPNGDAESVLRYRPTLVLCADYSRAELVAQLRRSHTQVLVFDHYATLDDAYANLRSLAGALGRPERAEAVIADCQSRVAALAARLRGARPVRVIAPSTYGLIAGYATTFEDLCEHAGGDNLAASLGRLQGNAPQPSEQMLAWPVDRVVLGGTDVARELAPFRTLPPYAYMAAIREGRAVLVPSYILGCVSQDRVQGYELLARALHPEAFR
jgi:iron complex transport system substrate-binding protein